MAFRPRRAASRAGLVDDVGQFRPGITRRTPRHGVHFDAFRNFHALGVDLQNLFASFHVGKRDGHLPVESARTQQRGVEHVGPVGGGDDDDAFLGVEAVHLDEQGVERLLAFVMAAADPVAAVPPYGVDFVDENQARRALAAPARTCHARGSRRRRRTFQRNPSR